MQSTPLSRPPVPGPTPPRNDSLRLWLHRVPIRRGGALRKLFQAEGYDQTPEQRGTLSWIKLHIGIRRRRFGAKTRKDRHNITRMLNVFKKHGLIEQRPDEFHRQVLRLDTTVAESMVREQMALLAIQRLAKVSQDII